MIDELKCLNGYLDKEFHTKEQILGMLQWMHRDMDERTLRDLFKKNNEMFIRGETELYLVHSNSKGIFGYKLTSNKDEILKSIEDNRSRAISQFKLYYGTKKRLSEMDQLTLEPNETDMWELVKKMQE